MRWLGAVILAVALVGQQSLPAGAGQSAVCGSTPYSHLALPGRVDSLLAGDATTAVLVGKTGSTIRFLPHDTLLVLTGDGGSVRVQQRLTLPQYLMAPGLAARVDGRRLYLLADSLVLTIDGTSGRVIARQTLPLQAIGWPAAVTADASGDLYLIGQPTGSWTAQVYAFSPDHTGAFRQRWRSALGLTHAGSWVGLASPTMLAVYLPDPHDAQGTIALFSMASGTLVRSYAVPVPPLSVDGVHDRLYLAEAGTIRVLSLHSGKQLASASGVAPLVVNSAADLVAFVRDGMLVVARADDLQVVHLFQLPPGGAPDTAAWQGTNVLLGNLHGVAILSLSGCTN